jgi:hypothetical protein
MYLLTQIFFIDVAPKPNIEHSMSEFI